MTEERLLIVPEVAERLRLSPKTVRKLLQSGELPGFRTSANGRWRISEADLERYVATTPRESRSAQR